MHKMPRKGLKPDSNQTADANANALEDKLADLLTLHAHPWLMNSYPP